MTKKVSALAEMLTRAHAAHMFPGCAAAFVTKDTFEPIFLGAHTYDADSPAVTADTVYDTASLTKIIGPMSIAMMLIDAGTLSLTECISTYLPEYARQPFKAAATLAHLLTYTLDYELPGGTKSLMTPNISPRDLAQMLIALPLKQASGTSYRYSNVTAFLLTQVIERATKRTLHALTAEKIFTPLAMKTATFSPKTKPATHIPPTEITSDRGVVHGFVHDESTYFLHSGNITSGAAGLFASITDIAHFIQMTIGKGVYTTNGSSTRLFSDEIVALWTQDNFPTLLPMHTPLGWGDDFNGLIDPYHRQIVVKSGFTGCFMMADLKNEIGCIVLSNRTYPSRPHDSSNFKELKRDMMRLTLD